MKTVNRIAAIALTTAFAISSAATTFAQEQDAASKLTRERVASKPSDQDKTQVPAQKQKPTIPSGERLEPDETKTMSADVPADAQANRTEQISEEAAVLPYYNNFFSTYRLGPEDVISVNVFGQDRYSRGGITIPPSGRVSLALIPGGIFVNGKTVEEVAELIKQKYDEYIIDPQISVSLDKAS